MIAYKYRPLSRLEDLTRRELAFSAPNKFNDPFEMSPVLGTLMRREEIAPFVHEQLDDYLRQGEADRVIQLELAKYRPLIERQYPSLSAADLDSKFAMLTAWAKAQLPKLGRPVLEDFLALDNPSFRGRFIDSLYHSMNKRFRVLSLSATCESILMWSHYSDSHCGFAIGFDVDSPFFDMRAGESDFIRKLKPVEYRDRRPQFDGFSENDGAEEAARFADLLLFSKSADWAYEQEWRMVQTADAATGTVCGDGLVSLFSFPPEMMKCVVLGARASEETAAFVESALASDDCGHVRLLQASLDPEHYAVVVRERK